MQPDSYYLSTDTIPPINAGFASVLVTAMAVCAAAYARRVVRSTASGKRWSVRRKKVRRRCAASRLWPRTPMTLPRQLAAPGCPLLASVGSCLRKL